MFQLLVVEVSDVIDFLHTDNACLTVPDLTDDLRSPVTELKDIAVLFRVEIWGGKLVC